ncbi:MAG: ADP-ribosylglycohydrolase family protein [Candidatus Hodarchaeales archaeon]|jgi:poly(ADP-ribose) glycohydrolase ARH3
MKDFSKSTLERKFIGSILGSVIGDSLGARFEGRPFTEIPLKYLNSLIDNPELNIGKYTDDTQMMKGLIESLIKNKGLDCEDLAQTFVNNFDMYRGYGIGTIQILDKIRKGTKWYEAAKSSFSGQGSLGNGAAMRIAPIGLLYYFSLEKIVENANKSAIITHTHELGIEGAILQALSVGIMVKHLSPVIDIDNYLDRLIHFTHTSSFKRKLDKIESYLDAPPSNIEVINSLGNKITALESVPTSLFMFLANYRSGFKIIIRNAILLGGDTDTIACMTGAIAGAYFGVDNIPQNLIQSIEEKDTFISLSKRLFSISQEIQNQ